MDLSIITQLIQDGNAYLEVVLNGNDFAIAAIMAALSGATVYLTKDVPMNLYQFSVKHLTTKLEVNNTQESFHLLMRYLMKEGVSNNSRTLRLSNGRTGENNETTKEIGYGHQLFLIKGYPVYITVSREESGQSKIVKEFITIRKPGRSHKLFDDLLKELQHNRDESKLRYYRWDWDARILITEQPKYHMSQVILSESNRESLINTVDNFIAKEDWYLQHNIPYQLGILLYGPPGTGKGVLTKALAGYLSRDILMVNNVNDLTKASEAAPSDCIIMVDEVDTIGLSDRDETLDNKEKRSIGQVLTALDGGVVNHGRIIVMTTNHHETLDEALLRPGRVDLKLELGYLTTDMFGDMLQKFFQGCQLPDGYTVKEKLSPAEVQNMIMLGYSRSQLMELYCAK